MTTLPSPLPLNQRRNFALSTTMPPSTYEFRDSGAGQVLTNLPRRKGARKRYTAFVTNRDTTTAEGHQRVERDRCWSQVVPNIFAAFHEKEDGKVAVVDRGKKYTHIITISLAQTAGMQEVNNDFPDGSFVHALHLSICSPEHLAMRSRRAGLGLSPDQLKKTTMFLSKAFSSATPPRVMITCCHGRQTDVMCIIVAHLSKSLEEDAAEVLKVIDLIDELRSVWKGEVNEDEVGVIRTVLSAD